MKKLLSVVIAAVVLAAMLAPAASADLLWTDNFDSGVFSEADWRVEGSAFALTNGGPTNSPHLEGWAEAVVQQSSYGEDAPAPRVYGPNFAVKCDTWFYGDGGNSADEHWVALWWADHFENQIGMDVDRIVYFVRCYYEARKVVIMAHGENGGTEFYPEDTVLAEWQIPDDVELEMDPSAPTVFNLGMRVNGQQIDGFFNNQKVVSATLPTIHQYKCPLLFWNGGCWTGYDNWMVSTADYDLFNEGANMNNGGNGNGGNGGNGGNAVETVIVTDTDAEGNIVTRVETRPAANNGGAATGGNAAKTGDAAIIAVAVMIVALGSAIVVKKVSSK